MGDEARNYKWPPFEAGNTEALRHGARSPRKLAPLAAALAAEVIDVAPWLAQPAFAADVAAWAWAEAECRLRRADMDEHGLLTPDGDERPGGDRHHRAETRAANLRAALGLQPMAMARLLGVLSAASAPGVADDVLDRLRALGRATAASLTEGEEDR